MITASPRWQWLISAARLDCVPDGKNSPASKPKVSAARACSLLTVGSSPNTSSPSSASCMARRMPSLGRVTVSERRSTIAATLYYPDVYLSPGETNVERTHSRLGDDICRGERHGAAVPHPPGHAAGAFRAGTDRHGGACHRAIDVEAAR